MAAARSAGAAMVLRVAMVDSALDPSPLSSYVDALELTTVAESAKVMKIQKTTSHFHFFTPEE